MHRFKAYLPVVLWMAVIFAASTDLGSARRTSRLIGPFLRWFNPDVSEETIRAVQAFVRKSGHLTEYAVLAALSWRSRRVARGTRPVLSEWNWRESAWIALFCCIYAVSDEFHQKLVATRQASLWDVLLDTGGAFLGLVLIWFLGRKMKRW